MVKTGQAPLHVLVKSVPVNYALAMEVFQGTGELSYPESHDVLLNPTPTVQVDYTMTGVSTRLPRDESGTHSEDPLPASGRTRRSSSHRPGKRSAS